MIDFFILLLTGIKGPEFIVVVICTAALLAPVIAIFLDVTNYIINTIENY